MDSLFSHLLLILSCLCIYHHLLSFVKADEAQCCASVGELSFPFEDLEACTELESISINCPISSNYTWNASALSQAFINDEATFVAPTLEGIFRADYLNFINLTWNMEGNIDHPCHPVPAENLHTYIPDVINLTSFASANLSKSFLVSYYNYILLLNCSNLPSTPPQYLQKNAPVCSKYQQQCADGTFKNTLCAQIVVPTNEIMLHQALDSFNCTHFQIFVTANDSTPISSWTQGLIQLFNGDAKCQACIYETGGTCIYDMQATPPIFQKCSQSCKGLKCNTGVIIAIGVSSAVVATVILMMVVLGVYYKKTGYSIKSFTSSSSNRLFTQRAYMLSKKFGPVATKEFSFDSLSKATKSFADENMIGDGGFGAVYLGILKDGRKVAVKRLYHDNFRRMEHFYNEIKILSNLSHPNLVKLYGFCCQDSRDLLLVFEYASNGTISDQLHDATKPSMPWKTRLNIAWETAEALSYLHNVVNPPIYHRDVKTTNILLDDDLHAKLADFGLSRLVPLQATHVSTDPQGTPGYLDPDYHQTYQLTDKSDVYSFGVVLMELVSAKLAVDMSRDRREINLSNLALMKIGCGQWEDLVDPHLEIKKNPDVEKMVKRVVELAFMCLHAEKDSRPTVKFIAETLASMCKEFGYGDDVNGRFSFKVDIKSPSSADETSQLIKSKSSSKSTLSADSPPSSADSTSSNASSYVKSI